MQCVNCGFENIPGLEQCVRCQSSLALATVDVAPPRADRLRLGNRVLRGRRIIAEQVVGAWQSLPRWGRMALRRIPEVLVPGLGYLWRGKWLFGWLFLAGWVSCLLGWLVLFGSQRSWQMLATALCIHTVALVLLANRPRTFFRGIAVRGALGLALFVTLGLLVYWPMRWLGTQFYSPFPVSGVRANPIFGNDDVLLYQGSWRRPLWFQRGDIVIYDMTQQRLRQGFVAAEGFGLDRIVGIPGDHVTIEEGKVLVNGRPAMLGERPLIKLPENWNLEIQADYDQYVILPSSIDVRVHGNVRIGPILSQVSLVREADILGRVVFRTYPWSRWGPIH